MDQHSADLEDPAGFADHAGFADPAGSGGSGHRVAAPAPTDDAPDPAEQAPELTGAAAAARELTARVTDHLTRLDGQPVSAHAEVYAAAHADLHQALDGLGA